MEIKWKQPKRVQSQSKQNLKPKPNRGNGLLNHVSTFPRVFHSFCLNSPLFTNPSLPYSQPMVS